MDNGIFGKNLEFFAKYAFKLLDIAFKIISWALILVALRYASKQIDSRSLEYFTVFMQAAYFAGLTLFCIYILCASREQVGLPVSGYGLLMMLVFKLGALMFMMFLTDLRQPMDYVFNRLIEMKISK